MFSYISEFSEVNTHCFYTHRRNYIYIYILLLLLAALGLHCSVQALQLWQTLSFPMAYGILVPQPGIQLLPPALGTLDHQGSHFFFFN